MRIAIILSAAALAASAPALADVTLVDGFDTEAGGNTSLNETDLDNFETASGSVDVVKTGDYGIACAGNAGSCIDLDGSTGQSGLIQSRNSYTFTAGNLVTLTFDLSGNQRNAGIDDFIANFVFANPTAIRAFTIGGTFGAVNFGNFAGLSQIGVGSSVAANAPFGTYSVSFRTLTNSSLKLQFGQSLNGFGTQGLNDNQGPLLDNVRLSIAAVPEPATWAMMILGFGVIGAALRRRRQPAVPVAFG